MIRQLPFELLDLGSDALGFGGARGERTDVAVALQVPRLLQKDQVPALQLPKTTDETPTGQPGEHAGRFGGRGSADATCIRSHAVAKCMAMAHADQAGRYVVTGATGAVGSAVAAMLAARGASLVLLARDEARLRAVAEPLGARWHLLPGVEAAQVAGALLEAAAGEPVAGVAHCVGSLLLKPAHRTTAAEWQQVVDVNLSSAFGVAMALPQLLPHGGAVVFVGSVAATLGLANHEAIAAAKAGLIGLTRALAATHVRRGIRCHCVAPALVESRMTGSLLARPGAREAAGRQNPMGRIGAPDDVARTIVFLLDPANGWLTGQVVGVDGGFGAVRPLA